MADELNEKKAFLTWEESVVGLQTDAGQGSARAQRLLAMRYLRGRGVPKDETIAFYWMQLARTNKILPWHTAVWASSTKMARVSRRTLPWRLIGIVLQQSRAIPSLKNICNV